MAASRHRAAVSRKFGLERTRVLKCLHHTPPSRCTRAAHAPLISRGWRVLSQAMSAPIRDANAACKPNMESCRDSVAMKLAVVCPAWWKSTAIHRI